MAKTLEYIRIEITKRSGEDATAKISYVGKDGDYSKSGSQDFALSSSRTEADMIAQVIADANTALGIS